ncbi:MAG: CDP-diacylglycerol--glycerol-3-phosphate 3-phosphatidyltransferase [Myxococcota bacterium]|nr:CDP-diacylglycerol--glycerol-3-phosphate 3-phosphatidyltransferase [Myxococcota bacterium]
MKQETTRNELWALPNLITYFRILAIPAVLCFMLLDSRLNAFIATLIFTAASASDALDGYLARKYKLVSNVGKFLDPLADKLLVMAVLVMLVHLSRVSVWLVILLLAREMTINGLRAMAASEGLIIAARSLGKLKTMFQMCGLWGLLVWYSYDLGFADEPYHFGRMGHLLLWISVIFAYVSGFDYLLGYRRARQAQQSAE